MSRLQGIAAQPFVKSPRRPAQQAKINLMVVTGFAPTSSAPNRIYDQGEEMKIFETEQAARDWIERSERPAGSADLYGVPKARGIKDAGKESASATSRQPRNLSITVCAFALVAKITPRITAPSHAPRLLTLSLASL
jgi:hypothetical protein